MPGQLSDYLGFDLMMIDDWPCPSVLPADSGYDARFIVSASSMASTSLG